MIKSINHGIYFALFVFLTTEVFGQFQSKMDASPLDTIVSEFLEPNAIRTGNITSIEDSNNQYIVFFEIKPLNNTRVDFSSDQFIENPFRGIPTVTLFCVLSSNELSKYSKQIIDTLDENSGCCPCHMPYEVLDFKIEDRGNSVDAYLTMMHPVKLDCNSMSRYFKLSYINLKNKLRNEIWSIKPDDTIYLDWREIESMK